ncbi:hypothetical protein [Fretibacter rubidus]|uniref:hypothetical protein n=1 Tax=Fretibacter rubidus TaxID=570162 RepID=UPI00352BBEF3
MNIRQQLICVMTFAVALTACSQSDSSAQVSVQATDNAAPVLTVITEQAPETQLMALILSKAAVDQGSPVQILLCDKGGDLALKSPPTLSQQPLAPKNMSPAGLLSKLINSGVKVDVCAIYLPNRTFGEDALIDGVGVATPPEIAGYFTQVETKILSF